MSRAHRVTLWMLDRIVRVSWPRTLTLDFPPDPAPLLGVPMPPEHH